MTGIRFISKRRTQGTWCFLVAFLGWHALLPAQVPLAPDAFLRAVVSAHPELALARQQADVARAYRLKTFGMQDPYLDADFDQKQFDGNDYFRVGSAGMYLPTAIGLKAGLKYGWSDGIYLNPQENLPASGLGYLSLELPLGRGLLNNPIRTERNKVPFYEEYYVQFGIRQRNALIVRALSAYWSWAATIGQRDLTIQALELARLRLDLIRTQVVNGDAAAIDSVEASLQVRQRMVELTEWDEQLGKDLARISADFLPGRTDIASLVPEVRPITVTEAPRGCDNVSRHPEWRSARAAADLARADAALARDWIKPDLRVKFQLPLSERGLSGEPALVDYLSGNYLLGLSFKSTVTLRKERGEYQLVRLESEAAALKEQLTGRKLLTDCESARRAFEQTRERQGLLDRLVLDYDLLREAENLRFSAGESSLFLVNAREQRWLESRIKKVKTDADLLMEEIRMRVAAGEDLYELYRLQ